MTKVGLGAVCLTVSNPVVQYIVLSTTVVTIDPNAPFPSGLTAEETEQVMRVCAALIVGVFGGTGLTMDQILTAKVSEQLRKLGIPQRRLPVFRGDSLVHRPSTPVIRTAKVAREILLPNHARAQHSPHILYVHNCLSGSVLD